MNLPYILPRLARHFMPAAAVRFLLRRGLIIHPGLETRSPRDALARYLRALDDAGISVQGKRVMVFGYGGSFAIGCAFLEAGASHAVLVDRFAPPDDARNRALLSEYGAYLVSEGDAVRPRAAYLTLMDDDIHQIAAEGRLAPVDLVVSSSVYEHLDDVEGITRALAALTALDGVQLHFIDLRDHFFKYPFEMLTFSDAVWRRYLNPTSNLNRYRLPDYRRVFEAHFQDVEIAVLARDLENFRAVQHRIRPEFLTGDPEVDAATQIRVRAARPFPATPRVERNTA
jgi:hypothetical protein